MKKRLKAILENLSCEKICSKIPLLQSINDSYNDLRQNPYIRMMRLDNLTGFWLLVIPVWWSVCLASKGFGQALYYGLIATIGALVMRSAGCVVNDIVDRDYDKDVERTASRPLAAGELVVNSAYVLLFGLLSIALALLMMLPIYSMKWAALVVILVCIYPFMKRYTSYAQLFLGFVFNSGVLIMWFAINPTSVMVIPFVLYFAAITWTVAYDTIYAYQDMDDDVKLGLKSMAIKVGPKANDFLWNLYQLMTISICIAGLAKLNLMFFVVMAATVYWFYPKIKTLDSQNKEACDRAFKLNVNYGMMIVLAILVGMI